jgi:hypothetical protein
MGQEKHVTEADLAWAEEIVAMPADNWCCMYLVISLWANFVNEKPLLQHYLEGQGHVCMFLPKFHCKLNLIENIVGLCKI